MYGIVPMIQTFDVKLLPALCLGLVKRVLERNIR